MVILGVIVPMGFSEDIIGLSNEMIKQLESLLVQVYSRMYLFLSMESYLERQDIGKEGFRKLQEQIITNHEQFAESIIEFLNKRRSTSTPVNFKAWMIPNNKKNANVDNLEYCNYTANWDYSIKNYVTTTNSYQNYSSASSTISFAGRLHCDLYQKIQKLRLYVETETPDDFHLQDWLDGKLQSYMNLMNKLLILQTRLKRIPQIGIAELVIDAELQLHGTSQYQI